MSPTGFSKKPTETAEYCHSVANAYDELIISKRRMYDRHIQRLEAKRSDWLQKAADYQRIEKLMTAEYGPAVLNTEKANGIEC